MEQQKVFLIGTAPEETTRVESVLRASLFPGSLEYLPGNAPMDQPDTLSGARAVIVRYHPQTAAHLQGLLGPLLISRQPPVIYLVDGFAPALVNTLWNQGAWRVLPLDDLEALLAESLAVLFDGPSAGPQTEQEPSSPRDRYRDISENARDIIFLISRFGVMEYANPAACRAVGVDPCLVEGIPVGQFFPRAFAATQMSMFYEMHEMARPIYTESVLAVPGSDDPWLGTWLVPILNENGQLISALGIARDITEAHQRRTALEESLDAERSQADARSSFFSMTAHQFRTPLSSILLSTEVLRKYGQQLDTQKRLEHLERIEEAAKRLNSMLEDILVISRIESGRYMVYPKDFDLITFVRETLNEMRLNDRRAHELEYSHDRAEIPVHLDPEVLHRLLDNLLSNALKYSPPGTKVSVNVVLEDQTVLLEVSDQGIGIPETDMPVLFQPYRRGSNAGSIPGTGIGLTIIQKSVELLRGKLSLQSNVGQGTTFQVRFPVHLVSSTDAILV